MLHLCVAGVEAFCGHQAGDVVEVAGGLTTPQIWVNVAGMKTTTPAPHTEKLQAVPSWSLKVYGRRPVLKDYTKWISDFISIPNFVSFWRYFTLTAASIPLSQTTLKLQPIETFISKLSFSTTCWRHRMQIRWQLSSSPNFAANWRYSSITVCLLSPSTLKLKPFEILTSQWYIFLKKLQRLKG